jgi:hypothetical protein
LLLWEDCSYFSRIGNDQKILGKGARQFAERLRNSWKGVGFSAACDSSHDARTASLDRLESDPGTALGCGSDIQEI